MSPAPSAALPAPTCIQAEAARDLAQRRLDAGDELRLVVSGGSMLPTLRPGDRLVVRAAQALAPGALAVLRNPRGWTVHRLIALPGEGAAGRQALTKGDSRRSFDPPWNPDAIAGVVCAVEQGGWRRDLTAPAAARRAAWLARLSGWEGRLNAPARRGAPRRYAARLARALLALLAGWDAGRRRPGE